MIIISVQNLEMEKDTNIIMSENVIEALQNLRLDPYIVFIVTGDMSKTFYLPIWGQISPCPSVFIAKHQVPLEDGKTEEAICNIWDILPNTNYTTRMFFPEDVNYCIIIYDIPFRAGQKNKFTLEDYIDYVKRSVKAQDIIVLVMKNSNTKTTEYNDAMERCSKLDIHSILVDRSATKKVSNLVENLAQMTIKSRRLHLSERARVLLSELGSENCKSES